MVRMPWSSMPLGLRRKQNWKEGVVELWCNHKGLSRPHTGPWTCNGPSEPSHTEARRAGLYTHPTWASQWVQAFPTGMALWLSARPKEQLGIPAAGERVPDSWGRSLEQRTTMWRDLEMQLFSIVDVFRLLTQKVLSILIAISTYEKALLHCKTWWVNGEKYALGTCGRGS